MVKELIELNREELFEEWKELESSIISLKEILQNSIDSLTLEDIRNWEYSVNVFEEKLREIRYKTTSFLHLKRKRYINS